MEDDAVVDVERLEQHAKQHQQHVPPSPNLTQLYSILPLPDGSRSIRVLDIDAPAIAQKSPEKTGNCQIAGRIRVVRLEDSPSFTALSYVWGSHIGSNPDSHPDRSICCALPDSDLDIEMTENCFQALCHVQQQFGAVTIWVDSICINQDDNDEKARQIPLMEEIYSCAESVYVWLGEGNERSDRAMKYLREMARWVDRPPLALFAAVSSERRAQEAVKFRKRAWKDMIFRIQTCLSSQPLSFDSADPEFLDEVLDREWTHRSWTFQELILSRDPVFLCGHATVSWEDLSAVLRHIQVKSSWREDIVLPVSNRVHTHWQSMVDLWMGVPRAYVSHPKDWVPKLEPPCFQDHIDSFELVGAAYLPRGFRRIGNALIVIHLIVFLGSWGYTSYVVVLAFKEDMDRNPERYEGTKKGFVWYLFFWLWAAATLLAYMTIPGILDKFFPWAFRGRYRVHHKQHDVNLRGLLSHTAKTNSMPPRILHSIQLALDERTSLSAHDKSFSLYGILKACGASLSTPDYARSVEETHHRLFTDLLCWRPEALSMLVDAQGSHSSSMPSWVPNWNITRANSWLALRYGPSSSRLVDYHRRLEQPEVTLSEFNCSLLGVEGRRVGTVTHSSRFSEKPCLVEPAQAQTEPDTSDILEVLQWQQQVTVSNVSPLYRITTSVKGGWKYPSYIMTDKNGSWSDISTILNDYLAALPTERSVKQMDEGCVFSELQLQEVLQQIQGDRPAHDFFTNAVKILTHDRRCLFLASKDPLVSDEVFRDTWPWEPARSSNKSFVGTGPLDLEIGDEVFILKGVPAPMILRPHKTASETPMYSVVGPAFVSNFFTGGGLVSPLADSSGTITSFVKITLI
ncbi:heterokaryon incompatibility protein-domain-containing protein [Podospora australis]|uniref:Heterokaryon incompatibility protein-domain-containing protein n=1 Tax=Podospora australis TaxID=1536484 RepID=A0AAN6WQQ7_9PEZI|nr:heterokaryon incompatibility protein-domain-containing protein [Podospora australis]